MKVGIPKALASGRSVDQTMTMQRAATVAANSINVSMLGKIESFNSTKQTATISPIIRKVQGTDKGRTIEYETVDVEPLVNVPVIFPGAGGWHLTMPVAVGDECLVIFTDESIGNWKKYGDTQDPQFYKRFHSRNDAVAIVGIHPPVDPITDFNSSDPEIRNADGSTKFTIKNGEVTFNGDITVTGGDVVADGISLKTHVHPSGTAVTVDPNTGIGSTTAPTGTPT